jgi:uncharacterized protein DUF6152
MPLTRTMTAALVAGAVMIATQSVGAHHSAAMFDDEKVLELQGVVKELQWTNPHIWLQVIVADEKGTKTEWSLEGGSPNTLSRRGWRPTIFKPGDVVTVRLNPMKDGTPAGGFVGAKFADGKTIGRWE